MITSQKTLPKCYKTASEKLLYIKLLEYYRLIDQAKVDEVLRMFSKDAQYLRCGEAYKGYEQIEYFYKVERKIKGSHTIKNLWIVNGIGIVEGNTFYYDNFFGHFLRQNTRHL